MTNAATIARHTLEEVGSLLVEPVPQALVQEKLAAGDLLIDMA